jgi:hypothetical protein
MFIFKLKHEDKHLLPINKHYFTQTVALLNK